MSVGEECQWEGSVSWRGVSVGVSVGVIVGGVVGVIVGVLVGGVVGGAEVHSTDLDPPALQLQF